MADYKSLVVAAGVTRQIADADSLVVGAGLKPVTGVDLVLSAGTGQTINFSNGIELSANVGITALAGTGAIDFSLATGIFKTSTGVTTIAGQTTFTATATPAVTVNNNASIGGTLAVTGSGTFTGAVNANGGVQRSTSGALSIGTGSSTTSITMGSTSTTAINIGTTMDATTDVITIGAAVGAQKTVINNNLKVANIDTNTSVAMTIGGATASSVAIGRTGVGTTINGLCYVNSLDTPAVSGLSIGTTNANDVIIGRSGFLVEIAATTFEVDTIDTNHQSTLTIGTTNCSAVYAAKPLKVGTTAPSIDVNTSGALTIGTVNATSVTIGTVGNNTEIVGQLAVQTTYPSITTPTTGYVSVGGANTTGFRCNPPLYLGSSIDMYNAGAMNIGTLTATSINIGKVGILTTVKGNLQVDGTETVVGLTTFTGDAQFNGNVVFGNAVTDTVSFQAVIGNGSFDDLVFNKLNSHDILIGDATTADLTAFGLGIYGQKAGPSSAATGKAGGSVDIAGGQGAAGSTFAAGTGGTCTLRGGQAGAVGTGAGAPGGNAFVQGGDATGNNAGGSVHIRGGTKAGTGAHGAIWIGDVHSGTISLGNNTDNPAVVVHGTYGLNIEYGLLQAYGSVFLDPGNIQMKETTTPTTYADHGNVYVKDVSGYAELFYKEGSTSEVQITTQGQLNAIPYQLFFLGTNQSGGTINAGQVVCLSTTATAGVKLAEADASTYQDAIGICYVSSGAGSSIKVVACGEVSIPDAYWVTAPTTIGQRVYLSETAGRVTTSAPIASGSVVQKIGIVSNATAGARKILVQIGDSTLL